MANNSSVAGNDVDATETSEFGQGLGACEVFAKHENATHGERDPLKLAQPRNKYAVPHQPPTLPCRCAVKWEPSRGGDELMRSE